MSNDQNSIPKDLRPLNLPRNIIDEPRIGVGNNTVEGFCPNSALDINTHGSRSVFYPATISEPGYGTGLRVANPAMTWFPPQPGTLGGGGGGGGFIPVSTTGFRDRDNIPNFINQGGSNVGDQASDEGTEEPSPGKKFKFLCSFGGKILPRPSDGILRYVGGQTRIISVKRDVSFQELVQKMNNLYGQPVVFKYQLPDEDLDALVSVSCPEDLDNMIDEYEKLVESSVDGLAKLRVFLFSAYELDSSGSIQLGDPNECEQKYLDAVNGIPDIVSCNIKRQGSTSSMSSTKNSDSLISGGGGCDVVNSPSLGHEPPSPVILSPRGNSGASSHDGPARVVYVAPHPVIYGEAQATNFGAQMVAGSHSQAGFYEPEFERPVLGTGQQQQVLGHEFRPASGMEFSPTTAYMGYPHQEAFHSADYPPVPSKVGYSNPPQVLGISGPSYARAERSQQLQGNPTSVQTHQFMPSIQMTTASSTAYANTKPGVQHFVYPNQTQVNLYPDESSFGARMSQIPVNQNYRFIPSQLLPPQVPVPLQGGSATTMENMVFSDGWSPRHPEQIRRLDDCHMCQKELPHAHSDTLVQDQRDQAISMASAPVSAFQSLRSEDSLRTRPPHRVMVSEPLGDGTIFHPGTMIRQKYVGNIDQGVGSPQFGLHGFPQNMNVCVQNGNEGILLQNPDSTDYRRMMVPPGVVTDNLQSPFSVVTGHIPQTRQEDARQQPTVPFYNQNKHDHLMNQPVHTDMPNTRILPFQTSEPLLHGVAEHPGTYSGKDTGTPYDNVTAIDGRIETIRINPSEISGNYEHCISPNNKLNKEEILDTRPQITRMGVPQTNALNQTSILGDGNHIMPTEGLPSSYGEAAYLCNLQPEELVQGTQPPGLGISGPFSHLNIGTQHLGSDKIWHGEPAFSPVDSAYVDAIDRRKQVGEWVDETSRFQPMMVPSDAVASPLSSNPPAIPVSNGEPAPSESLFSNDDPWNLRHDSHFPPPKPNKLRTSGEASVPKDGVLDQAFSNLNKDLTLENVNSSKGSAEDYIKGELQAVAEGVAASVLQSSVASDQSDREIKKPMPETNRGRELHRDEVEEQDIGKVSDKMNPAQPISDGIGRLQIIKNSDLEELRELGSGTFGTVYHGKWRGTDVAIKRINERCFAGKPSEQNRMRDDFWNEAIKLADLHHPNVVAFYGVVLDGPGGSVATVTEYMVNGSLRQAFQRNDKILDKRKRLLIAMDVAFGMEYLHGKNIVHFDLKTDNLLVNLRDPHRPICKVGDLGLSKVKCQTLISGGVRGTLPWMAPELLNGSSNLVSEKVDVFSFGIVMWELLTGDEPYADLHYGAIIGGIVSNTLRPEVPESCDADWRLLMEKCWSSEPSERPSFTEVANDLRSIAASLPNKGQAQ